MTKKKTKNTEAFFTKTTIILTTVFTLILSLGMLQKSKIGSIVGGAGLCIVLFMYILYALQTMGEKK